MEDEPGDIPTFDSFEDFAASGLDGALTAVSIGGVTWHPRDEEPPHEDHKGQVPSGGWWSPDYLVVVAAGQSNMVGSKSGTPPPPSGNVMMLDPATGELVVAAPAAAGSSTLYLPFAEDMAAAEGQPVLIVAAPVSGSRIDSWIGSGANWATLDARVEAALLAVGQAGIDAFLWHQGEGDYPLGAAVYEQKLATLIGQVRDSSWGGATVPILVGELSREGVNQAQNAALQHLELTEADPYLAFVSSVGLNSFERSGVHFDGASLAELGHRYWQAFEEVAAGVAPPPDAAPALAPGAPIPAEIVMREGEVLTLDASAWFVDPDGDDLWFYGQLTKRGVYACSTDADGNVVLSPDHAAAGTYTLRVWASDGRLDGPAVTLTLRILDAAPGVVVYARGDFAVQGTSAATYALAQVGLAANAGIDVLAQSALAPGGDAVLTAAQTIRGAAGLTGLFTLAEGVQRLTFAGAAAFAATGNAVDNLLTGNGGANALAGEGGRDRLYGQGGDDALAGGAGNDQLWGGDGADVLAGGAGADQAWGEGGGDAFVFESGGGEMQARDWQDGVDRIEVRGFAGLASYADLLAAATETASSGRVTFALGADRLVVYNATLATLSEADFAFG